MHEGERTQKKPRDIDFPIANIYNESMVKMAFTVRPVTSCSELKEFIAFPYHFHRQTPNWVPPLKIDRKNIFNPKKNSMLRHCHYQLFLLYQHHRIIGRIAAYVNRVANSYWKTKIGFFGYYECIDHPKASSLLLETAEKWLVGNGMQTMRGQWNWVSQDIGFICEGFELHPIILSSYNPPYYNDQVVTFGMKKVKDLLVYNCDLSKGYKIPERFLAFTDRIAHRYRVTVRPVDRKHLVRDTRIIVRLSNESLKDKWGYYPVEESEAEQIAADLKLIINPELIRIAEVDGNPIGYVVALPDVNDILKEMKGRLFPFGIFKLLTRIKKINRYRIWAMGILPAYQKRGISILLFRGLNDILAPKGAYIEINWVLEDNALMNNTINKLKFDLVKRYRIYEKQIG